MDRNRIVMRQRVAGRAMWTVALLAALSIPAAAQVFDTPAGSTAGGNPVDARATFTVSAGSLVISLQNLLVNPKTVAQNLSDLYFTVSSKLNSGSLASSSGQEVTIDGSGNATLGATGTTGWTLDTFDSTLGFHLNVLGTVIAPANTIIGAPGAGGTYSNANNSITGNGPHNPFINQTATFTVSIPGLAATDVVDSATFSFGTTAGSNVTGGCVRDCGGPPQGTPEPGAMAMLLGLGAPLAGFIVRRVRR